MREVRKAIQEEHPAKIKENNYKEWIGVVMNKNEGCNANSKVDSTFQKFILNKLTQLQKNNIVVSVYTNEYNTNKFSTGFIYGLSTEYVILAHIESGGMYDGYSAFKLDEIYSLEYDGDYERKILELYTIRKQRHGKISMDGSNPISNLLDFAFSNNYVITIELHDSNLNDVQGVVEKIEEEVIIIKSINEFGKNSGKKIVNINHITHIFCDTDTEIALRLLHNYMYNSRDI